MLRFVRVVLISSMACVLFNTAGCGLACGVSPVNDNVHVKDGVVSFDSTAVGGTETLVISLEDTVGAAETIEGATLTGPDAGSFSIASPFPIDVAKGATVNIAIRFGPKTAGTATATLTLQTVNMGPSPITLTGVATAQ